MVWSEEDAISALLESDAFAEDFNPEGGLVAALREVQEYRQEHTERLARLIQEG
jgi:hypothetical protein